MYSYAIFLVLFLTMDPCTACISFDTFATCTDLDGVISLPSTVKTLVLNGATTERLPSHFFSHLTSMVELNIKSSYFGIIEENAFADIPHLEILSISSSDISSVNTGAFDALRKLSWLNIEGTRIDDIQPMSFSNLNGIEDFVIKSSNISLIDSKAFYNISSVTRFQFYYNDVAVMKEGAFSVWKDVKRSTVNENTFGRLECFSDSSFTAMSFSFNRNHMDCACHVAWMLTSPLLEDKLLSNMCHDSKSSLNLGMTSVSMNDLNCPANPTASQLGCVNLESTTIRATTDVTTLPVTVTSTTETLLTATSPPETTSEGTAVETTSSFDDVITSDFKSSAPSFNHILTITVTSLIAFSHLFL